MIMIIVVSIVSFFTLNYIDAKEEDKRQKLYEIIDYKEDDENN